MKLSVKLLLCLLCASAAHSQTLNHLTLPPKAKNFEFLRTFPKLERISFQETSNNAFIPNQTAAEFWKEYDAKKK